MRAREPNGAGLEIAIYHNIDEDPATPDLWWLSVEERGRWRKREPGDESRRALESVFRDAGIELGPADR